jgi:pilus assembly protein TadC
VRRTTEEERIGAEKELALTRFEKRTGMLITSGSQEILINVSLPQLVEATRE